MLNENLGCSYNVIDSEGKNVLFYAYDCQDCLDFLASSQGCPWDIYDCQRRSLVSVYLVARLRFSVLFQRLYGESYWV